jgi:hypothetical protein
VKKQHERIDYRPALWPLAVVYGRDEAVTNPRELPRPTPAIRLGVVGHRDLEATDRAALRESVSRFLDELRRAVDKSLATLDRVTRPAPYVREPARFFLIDPLAEGADQLVAEVATQDGHGYRLRAPIPFATEDYKEHFTFHPHDSNATFDQLVGDPANDAILLELVCSTIEAEKGRAYAAAADVLLDNTDLLLALHDPSRTGEVGGTAETLIKATRSGIPVIGVDIRSPRQLSVLRLEGNRISTAPLTPDALQTIVARILLPVGLPESGEGTWGVEDQLARVQRFLVEPLITGSAGARLLAKTLHAVYRTFWLAVPGLGSIVASFRPRGARTVDGLPTPLDPKDHAAATTIHSIQRPYLERMGPVDRLAGFYMGLYQGSFVMNFLLGAMAVLFAVLAYFNWAHESVWLWADGVALVIILFNFVASRAWGWHERAVDYRFVAEYLRQTMMLAPLGRLAPLIRPSAHHGSHDPWRTWMGWYVRALHRDQGVADFDASSAPRVLRMDRAFLAEMRYRLCEDWLKDQYRYYATVERRFDAASRGLRALMGALFILAAAAVVAHFVGVDVEFDERAWRSGALLTILGAVPPAFLGALHGIAVQGEFDLTAGRAKEMCTYLARAISEIAQPSSQPECAAAVLLSNQAVEAAQMMLGEVLDWRILHQTHQVELT